MEELTRDELKILHQILVEHIIDTREMICEQTDDKDRAELSNYIGNCQSIKKKIENMIIK